MIWRPQRSVEVSSDESGATLRPLYQEQRGEESGRRIVIPYMVMGLGIDAYSARELFGWFAIGVINVTGTYGKGSNDFGFF